MAANAPPKPPCFEEGGKSRKTACSACPARRLAPPAPRKMVYFPGRDGI